ncbi:unnamed protein product [Paramecium sonneborni]|uniref:Transmembrane protein n=1 Tax=Paramecium sonneborni TaxID=65129 RepID=A0A8S1RWC0_9CILI|nr:unnamed protein product [Paramecium sonneborni]
MKSVAIIFIFFAISLCIQTLVEFHLIKKIQQELIQIQQFAQIIKCFKLLIFFFALQYASKLTKQMCVLIIRIEKGKEYTNYLYTESEFVEIYIQIGLKVTDRMKQIMRKYITMYNQNQFHTFHSYQERDSLRKSQMKYKTSRLRCRIFDCQFCLKALGNRNIL